MLDAPHGCDARPASALRRRARLSGAPHRARAQGWAEGQGRAQGWVGPGPGRGPSSGSGSGPGLGSAPDRATHLIAARLGDALLELSARDLGPARARRQEVRGGKCKRRPNSVVLSASATLPEPNRPASRRLTSARSLRRSAERRLTLGRAVVARRRRAQPRCSGRAAHRASFPIAFATDSSMGANASCLASTIATLWWRPARPQFTSAKRST